MMGYLFPFVTKGCKEKGRNNAKTPSQRKGKGEEEWEAMMYRKKKKFRYEIASVVSHRTATQRGSLRKAQKGWKKKGG